MMDSSQLAIAVAICSMIIFICTMMKEFAVALYFCIFLIVFATWSMFL